METEKVRLRVGDDHIVRLSSLGTAGYRWFHDVAGGQQPAVEVSKEWGRAPGEEAPPPTPGTTADEVFRIRAVHPGTATVHLAQRRPWEKESPLNRRVLEIEVED
jgi:predicted secreted protein